MASLSLLPGHCVMKEIRHARPSKGVLTMPYQGGTPEHYKTRMTYGTVTPIRNVKGLGTIEWYMLGGMGNL